MRTLGVLAVCGFLLVVGSCAKTEPVIIKSACETRGSVPVYKTRKDYSDKVSVQLSADKKRIISYPSPAEASRPVALENGYYLQTMKKGNAFLSVTIDQYKDSENKYSPALLINYVIDSNPFTEFYEVCECSEADPAYLNELIKTDQLKACHKI